MSLDNWGNWYPDPVPPAGLLPPFDPGGAGNDVTGSDADPNLAGLVPPDPTKASFYYEDSAQISFWAWSVNQQLWLGFVTP